MQEKSLFICGEEEIVGDKESEKNIKHIPLQGDPPLLAVRRPPLPQTKAFCRRSKSERMGVSFFKSEK